MIRKCGACVPSLNRKSRKSYESLQKVWKLQQMRCALCLTVALHYLHYICPFLLIASRLNVASAQNSTSQPRGSVPNLHCPSGLHCFNNTVRTVTIEWGHNGHICDGQFEEEFYGEKDPFGFVRGPRQQHQTVVQGDKVIFKPSEMITFRV